MQLHKFYLEAELSGTTYGKAEGGGLLAIEEPKPYETESLGLYLSIDESEAYEAKLDDLRGFDTEEEAEEAARPLLEKEPRPACLAIVQYVEYDEDIFYTMRVRYLTNALGQIEEAKAAEKRAPKEKRIAVFLIGENGAGRIEIENTLEAKYAALDCDLIDIQERYINGRLFDLIFDDESTLRNGLKIAAECSDYPQERITGRIMVCRSGNKDGEEHGLKKEDFKIIEAALRKTEEGEKALDGLSNERGLMPYVLAYTIKRPKIERRFTISERSAEKQGPISAEYRDSVKGTYADYEEALRQARANLEAAPKRRVYFVQRWETIEGKDRLAKEYTLKKAKAAKPSKADQDPNAEIWRELNEIDERPKRMQRRRKAYQIAKETGRPYREVLTELNRGYHQEKKAEELKTKKAAKKEAKKAKKGK